MDVKDQRITILGLGKSGSESARFLFNRGAKVFVSENKPSPENLKRKGELTALGIEVEIGQHSLDRIFASDRIIISPGISPATKIYQDIQEKHIPIWSEIELAYHFCPCEIIAVTGTNGKTTVTTLLHDIFKKNGYDVVKCGNIGNPFIGEVSKLTKSSMVVLEVSSFQLQHIENFCPYVGVVLNLTENHIDWHSSFENYARAKWNIFKNQTPDQYAVINVEDMESMRRSTYIHSQKVYFNGGESDNPDFAACMAVSGVYHLNEEKTRTTIREFRGIEHRLEEVESADGVRYINDSKSTSIASLRWALERMPKQVILIMGGRHKGGDFSQLQKLIAQKVKFMVSIGESARLLEKTFQNETSIFNASSLEGAFRCARAVSRKDDIVLFSPACASFDMFANYEDRGHQFKTLVERFQREILEVVS